MIAIAICFLTFIEKCYILYCFLYNLSILYRKVYNLKYVLQPFFLFVYRLVDSDIALPRKTLLYLPVGFHPWLYSVAPQEL